MADIYQPHDRLFRAVFSDASEAASLLHNVLPPFVRQSLDWTTLTPGTFIDEELRQSETDLLYQIEHTGTGQPASVYVLLEHQSSPDPLMPLRLSRYCHRIWEADLRDDPGRRPLRTIVPVVFYQGSSAWTYSTDLNDLFSKGTRAWPWIHRFSYVLLDQTTRRTISDAEVGLRLRLIRPTYSGCPPSRSRGQAFRGDDLPGTMSQRQFLKAA